VHVVSVSADCDGWGIEIKRPGIGLVMTEPAELGLSPPLRTDIRYWQEWFNGVFHHCNPEERYARLGARFDEVGYSIAERVAQELGSDYRVLYEPQGGWRIGEEGGLLPPTPRPVSGPSATD
jgi:hypothetical protein